MNTMFRRLTALILCIALLCSMLPTAFAAELKITTQPSNVSAPAGERASTTVTASGDGLTYQWYIAGKGSSKFSKSSITKATYGCVMSESNNGRQAYCVVTDANGKSVKSDTVTLTLRPALTITKQPASVTVKSGTKASVSIAAAGEGLSYIWYFKDAGASKFSKTSSFTGKTYSVTMDKSRDGRQVYCVVKDRYGSTVQTNTVTLSMQHPVQITSQPATAYAYEGSTARTTVSATGDGLSYTWYIANAGSTRFSKSSITKATYGVTMSAASDGRQVYCIVGDKYGNAVQSEIVTLNMVEPMAIVVSPQDTTVAKGEKAVVSFEAAGEGLTYTWYFKDAGATKFSKTSSFKGNCYSVTMDSTRAGRQVYCVIRDVLGNQLTTRTVTLDMCTPLVITSQPVDAYAYPGERAAISVSVKGDELKYQWYIARKDENVFEKSSITGAKYSAAMKEASDGRQAYCVVTDKYGNTVTSQIAVLHMVPLPEVVVQPQDTAVAKGEKAVVSFEAAGEGLTYTWYFKDAGATKFSKTSSFKGNCYSVTMDSTRAGRQVYCVIRDVLGNQLTTRTVTLDMCTPLVITSQPVDAYAYPGERAAISVSVKGDELKYQWYIARKDENVFEKSSITGAKYSAAMKEASDGRQAYCVVTDKYGNAVTSQLAVLHMVPLPEVVVQPVSTAAAAGEMVTVSVEATGDSLTYAWWAAQPGTDEFTAVSADGPAYSMEMNQAVHGTRLYCVVTDRLGTELVTDTVTLAMSGALAIVKEPENATVKSGETVTVTVEAVGDGLSYQWYFRDPAESEFYHSSIQGNVYSTTMQKSRDGRLVYCVVSDSLGNQVTTRMVSVFMEPVGNTDGRGLYYEVYADADGASYAVITGYTGSDASYTIPSRLEGAPVTAIMDGAFKNCVTLRQVTIPSSVTAIWNSAFRGCASLTAVNIPDSVRTIGENAFSYCSSLQSVSLPSGLTVIRPHTFAYSTALSSITIPNTVVTVGNMAFYHCSALTQVTLPQGLNTLGNYAFAYTGLEEVTLPAGLTNIGTDAFGSCGSLTHMAVTGEQAALVCKGKRTLTSVEILPGSTSIPDSAFSSCTSLVQVTLPASLRSIGSSAFFFCINLPYLSIPEGVTSIGSGAFTECYDLAFISLPSTLETLGEQAFSSCRSLQSISLPDRISVIGKRTFSSCRNLTDVKLPAALTEIGANAFNACSGITSLTLPSGVSGIGTYAFGSCTNLSSINIPSGVTVIEEGTFSTCSALKSMTLPSTVRTIGERAFYDCASLATVHIPEGVEKISTYAFWGCCALTSLQLPSTLKTIGSSAFRACSSITSVTFPQGLQAINAYAFCGCRSLRSVQLPGSLTTLGAYAFASSGLTSVTVPGSVSTVMGNAFEKSMLVTAVISGGVTRIGPNAFADCLMLTSVTVPATVTTMEAGVFAGSDSVTVSCKAGSAAHTYCTENNIPVRVN